MKEQQIVVIEQAEKDDYDNVLLLDKDGVEHKVGKKRGEAILNLVLNNEGKAVTLSYDSYKGHDYISNVELVSDGIKENPKAETPQQVESGISTDDIPVGVGVLRARSQAKPRDDRNRSFALAYSKDLAVADKIPPDKILSYAEVFVRWLDGEIQVTDEAVFASLLKKTFNVVGKEE